MWRNQHTNNIGDAYLEYKISDVKNVTRGNMVNCQAQPQQANSDRAEISLLVQLKNFKLPSQA